MISFIVPIYYKKKNYIYKRAVELIKIFEQYENIELIIVDFSLSSYFVSNNTSNIKVIKEPMQTKMFSPANARNVGVRFASKEYLLFFDVDLDFHESFIGLLLDEINQKMLQNTNSFLMIPCLYLSKNGTSFFESEKDKQDSINTMKESFLLGDNSYVERVAINTSLIVVRKKHFLEIGGFDESFAGHGGEDFELLHRLASFYPHSKRSKSSEYYEDVVSQFICDYKGFRQYLAYYSLEYLFSNLLIVHKWHPRPLTNMFYFRRVKNEQLLLSKMKEHDQNKTFKKYIWTSEKVQLSYIDFIKSTLLANNYDHKKYIGLCRFKEDVVVKRPISAKVRKLLTRPKQFFQDMKK